MEYLELEEIQERYNNGERFKDSDLYDAVDNDIEVVKFLLDIGLVPDFETYQKVMKKEDINLWLLIFNAEQLKEMYISAADGIYSLNFLKQLYQYEVKLDKDYLNVAILCGKNIEYIEWLLDQNIRSDGMIETAIIYNRLDILELFLRKNIRFRSNNVKVFRQYSRIRKDVEEFVRSNISI